MNVDRSFENQILILWNSILKISEWIRFLNFSSKYLDEELLLDKVSLA